MESSFGLELGKRAITSDESKEVIKKGIGFLVDKFKKEKSIKSYLQALFDYYSRSKSIIFTLEPKYLYEYYVELDVVRKGKLINNISFEDVFQFKSPVVISGLAGSGKTTLLKHLFLDMFRTRKEILPFFIELRKINDFECKFIEDFIHDEVSKLKLDLSKEGLINIFMKEKCFFFFDGLDEVDHNKRKWVLKEIDKLTFKYSIQVVLTSRPNNFTGWSSFIELKVADLTREKSKQIISKYLPDITDSKIEKFLIDVENNSYAKNDFFYQNPLLLSILIISYHLSCKIPNESYLFYKNAFDQLYQKHDSQKGWFARKRHYDGSKRSLESVFGAFSLLTYLSNKYHFKSDTEIKSYIRDAFKLVRVKNGSPNNLLKELVENCSMLVFEGQEIKYVHKSFQEYFAAQFLLDSVKELRDDVTSNFILPRDENILKFMYEIKFDQMEVDFSRVKLNLLLSDEYELLGPKEAYRDYVAKTHDEILLGQGFYSFPYNYESEGFFLPFIYDYYSREYTKKLKSVESIENDFDIELQDNLVKNFVAEYSKKYELLPFKMYLDNDEIPFLEGFRFDIKNVLSEDNIYEIFTKIVKTEFQIFSGLLSLKKEFEKLDKGKKHLVSSILEKYSKE